MKLSSSKYLALSCLAIGAACFSLPAHAQSVFNGSSSNDYGTAANWTPSGVPNLSTGATATINNGDAVTYAAGVNVNDFIISNGGELIVTSGSWTQTNGNNWIQLGEQGQGAGTGNGTILVNGGTFNQGTDSNNPFAITGTGNAFTITSGAANFNAPINLVPGLTFNFSGGTTTTTSTISSPNGGSGGTINVSGSAQLFTGGSLNINTGSTWDQSGGLVSLNGTNPNGEFDFNGGSVTMSGGTLDANLLTGVNGVLGSTFTVSGGILNLTNGIYAASSNTPVNFTLNSTGVINFDVSASTVNGYLTAGGIEYGGASDPGAFTVTPTGANSATLSVVAAPEPSTYVMFGLGFSVLLFAMRRRSAAARI